MDNAISTLETICPPWAPCEAPSFDDGLGDKFLDLPFSWEENELVLSNLKLNSAPGLVGVDYRVISKLRVKIHELMLELFNEIYTYGTFPVEWKRHAMFFIKKTDGIKVRPIRLASNTMKMLERLINNRLAWWLENQNMLPSTQFGFRKSKSCIDNLTGFNLDTRLAIEEGKHVVSLLLDIKGAYDNVLVDILMDRLIEIGIPSKLRNFIYNLMADRLIYCRFGNIDTVLKCNKGLPQGGVLSSILYALYVGKLENQISKGKVTQFADDISIHKDSVSAEEAIRAIEEDTVKVNNYLAAIGLEVAPEKCRLLVFSSNRKIRNQNWIINVNGGPIESVKDTKFLGVIFENTLKSNKQIHAIEKNCAKPIIILKWLKSKWWGADPEILLRLYKALISARIEYGSIIFYPLNKSQTASIERIQNRAIRVALGLRESTPVNVTLAEAKIPPIEMRVKFLSKNYLSEACANSNHPVIETAEA